MYLYCFKIFGWFLGWKLLTNVKCNYFLRDFERQYSCVDLFLSFFMIIFQIHFQIIYLWEILIKKYRIPKKKWDLSCDWCQIYISTSEIYQKYIQFYFRKAFVSKLLKDMVCTMRTGWRMNNIFFKFPLFYLWNKIYSAENWAWKNKI